MRKALVMENMEANVGTQKYFDFGREIPVNEKLLLNSNKQQLGKASLTETFLSSQELVQVVVKYLTQNYHTVIR